MALKLTVIEGKKDKKWRECENIFNRESERDRTIKAFSVERLDGLRRRTIMMAYVYKAAGCLSYKV